MIVSAGDKELTFDDLPEVMDAATLAKFLNVHRRTVYRRFADGSIRSHGKPRRIFKEELAEDLGIEYKR